MVQRKVASRKRRDSVGVVSEDGLAVAEDHVVRGGGGGGVVARAALPSYMRATTCSGAKVGGGGGGEVASAAAAEREAGRGKAVVRGGGTPRVSRATCSSAMKAGPAAAAAAEGAVCTYAYCSFKGHAHAPVLPLGSFVASRRRLIKTGQSMKHKGVSPFRKTNNNGGGVGGGDRDGLFVEVYSGAGATVVSSDVSSSDLSTEEMDAMVGRMEYVTFDRPSCRDAEDEVKDPDVSVDGSCGSSDVISDGFAEFTLKPCGGRREEIGEEEEASVDQEAEDFGACKSDISEELDGEDKGNISEDRCGDALKESPIDDMSNAFGRMIFKDEDSDPIDATTCKRNKLIISRRGTPKEGKRILTFNPRAPNFLPVKPDPDAEKVDLRHQMANDRKSADEWMVDYALRKAVKKLARAQKRKVEMLVQAFETVLPPVANEKKFEQNDGDKKNFTQTRTSQACN